MNVRRLTLASVLIVLIVLIPSGFVSAKEVVQVTITGPGLADALALTDADTLTMFQDLAFEGTVPNEPADVGTGYFEVQLAIGDGTQVVATNVYHYFPGINADHGYLYYADVIGGSSTAEGQWFELSDATDHDLRRLLREAGVRFGAASADCVATEQANGS